MADSGNAPQYSTFRKTHPSFGNGRICLYDRDGGLPPVVNQPTSAALKKAQWWLVHFPSRVCAAVPGKGGRAEGVRLCQQIKLGVDELGFIPVSGKDSHARGRGDRSRKGQSVGKAASEPAAGKGQTGVKTVKKRRKKRVFEPGLSFDQKMILSFPDERIIDEIDDLLKAEEELVIKGEKLGMVPDYPTRFNALKMLIEHAKGRPVEKLPPPPEKKKVSWEEIKTMIFTNESARMVLRGLIDDAEQHVKKAVNPTVPPAAAMEGAAKS